ncbi:MAG: isoamylase early set domain-containing protein [Endomicrobiia bacterium]|nr:isoamylase early set domain-containing protein [Endomicrobiia bacterium]
MSRLSEGLSVFFAVFSFVAVAVCALPAHASARQPSYETTNFVFYFDDLESDAYKERVSIAEITERIYEKTARRLNIRFENKISVYLVHPLFEGRSHGWGRASMTSNGIISTFLIYYPLNAWKRSDEFAFLASSLPTIEKLIEGNLEEGIVLALFLQKHLKTQKAPRKFNQTLYGFTAAFCERDVHSPARWIIDRPLDTEYPVSRLLKESYDRDVWSFCSSKFISFGAYLIKEHGFEKFEKLLVTAGAQNADELIKQYYGKTTDELESDWRLWLAKNVTEYRTTDVELFRQRANEISSFYFVASHLRDEILRRYFFKYVAAMQALLDIGDYSGEVYSTAQKLAGKKLKEVASKSPLCEVTFHFVADADAESVAVAGDFNDWNALATGNQMKSDKSEKRLWRTTVYLPMPGRYQYKFMVDGERWIADNFADGLSPDGHGGRNSVLILDGKNKKRLVEARAESR